MSRDDGEEVIARFWAKVHRTDGCWEWTGSRTQSGNGYGQFWVGGKLQQAHRVAWIFTNGPIPLGQRVLHRCDNRACVRLGHLFLGDQSVNIEDMAHKGRRGTLKLTVPAVEEIRRVADSGHDANHIAAEFGITRGHARRIMRGLYWRHVA